MEYLNVNLKEKRYKALEAKAMTKKLQEQKSKLKKTKKVKFIVKGSTSTGAPAPPKKCPEGQEYVHVKR